MTLYSCISILKRQKEVAHIKNKVVSIEKHLFETGKLKLYSLHFNDVHYHLFLQSHDVKSRTWRVFCDTLSWRISYNFSGHELKIDPRDLNSFGTGMHQQTDRQHLSTTISHSDGTKISILVSLFISLG